MKTIFRPFLSSPLLHFLLAGFIIFFCSYYVTKKRNTHTIFIDKAVMEKLITSWQTQFGKMPMDRELKIATDDYVRQEVLYREAESMGLGKGDEIIKRRLQQKMAFIVKDNIVVPEPGEAALETYYKKNTGKFSEPPVVSFSHIYFNADNGNTAKAKERAIFVLKNLTANHNIQRAPEMGDHFMLLYDYNDINKTDAAGLFGDSPFTDSLFTVKENQWVGPILSGYGWHILYVNKRLMSSTPPLNKIKDRVMESYKTDRLQELNNEAIEKMIEKYNVEIKVD